MRTLARGRDKTELLRRLKTLRPDSVRRWGRMSAHQTVCHLTDAFRMATGNRHATPATGLRQRTIVKWVALYLPVSWPAGVTTPVEIDQEHHGTCPRDFARDVAELEAQIERFTSPASDRDWPPHPVFGPLSEADWLRWGYLHVDHHLRQFGA